MVTCAVHSVALVTCRRAVTYVSIVFNFICVSVITLFVCYVLIQWLLYNRFTPRLESTLFSCRIINHTNRTFRYRHNAEDLVGCQFEFFIAKHHSNNFSISNQLFLEFESP